MSSSTISELEANERKLSEQLNQLQKQVKQAELHLSQQYEHQERTNSLQEHLVQLMPLLDSLRKVRESLKRVEVDDSEAAMIREKDSLLQKHLQEQLQLEKSLKTEREALAKHDITSDTDGTMQRLNLMANLLDEQLHALNHSNAGLRKRLQKTQLSPDNNRTSHIIDSMLQPFKGVFD